ncbi:MAG: cysteine desulfurase NifS [Verrucomicrobia bacterium]|nr:MAG: cysteine desulfurase NifS [Verrucomicrobiota bacterium]
MKLIYADNNATTPIAPEVAAVMQPFLTDQFFNPSSAYDQARRVSDALKEARKDMAALLGGINPGLITFTSCATESNNWAITGVARANPQRRHIITTAVEHPAVLEVCKDLVRQGYEVTFLPVDRSGQLDLKEYVRALRADTLLVTIMHANNETGVIFPIAELARLAHETDPAIVFHTDATQSLGKIPFDLKTEFGHVDLLSCSGHKLHAPKGVGALYIKRGVPIRPLLIGGHQENGRRAGTENVPHIVAFGRACRLAAEHMTGEDHIRALRDRLETALEEKIPYLEINGRGAPRLPNTLNLACHYIEGESILYELNAQGICASSGSACTSGSLEASHVLKAMNIPFTAMHGSVRFSLSRYNTPDEIERLIEIFPEIVARLRRISPYWDITKNAPRPTAPKG